MKYSGIGGQAVMEGVMMKNGTQYAVAVRKPDGEIIVQKKEYRGILAGRAVRKLPFLRGVVNFLDSMVLGMRTLAYSASFYEEGQDEAIDEQKKKKRETVEMGVLTAVSLGAAIVLFMLLPYFITGLFKRWTDSQILLTVLEGALRLGIFFAYIVLISRLEDIRREFMYHGAEHKCINCIEHGMELTVNNVRKCSRLHKRCGTSFLFFVVCISIVFFMLIRTDSALMRVVARILLVPVIAGCAYEFLRLAGKSENALVHLLSRPGLALQKLTTREPDDAMIEVGIASVEAVYDWKAYLKDDGKS
ncbi:MAG: DUF1385 domain-containing protein [Eubacterium sp.]|nr:DUF1385 domain-containing protein [Eubacterium sp.]